MFDPANLKWALDQIDTVLLIHEDPSREEISALEEYAGISSSKEETAQLLMQWSEGHDRIDPISVYLGVLISEMAGSYGSE